MKPLTVPQQVQADPEFRQCPCNPNTVTVSFPGDLHRFSNPNGMNLTASVHAYPFSPNTEDVSGGIHTGSRYIPISTSFPLSQWHPGKRRAMLGAAPANGDKTLEFPSLSGITTRKRTPVVETLLALWCSCFLSIYYVSIIAVALEFGWKQSRKIPSSQN